MARGPERVQATAPAEFLYYAVEEMPWEQIESVAGKSFTATQKKEIFHCTREYSAAMSFGNAATAREVEELRDVLLDAAGRAARLGNRYTPPPPESADERDQTVLHGLVYTSAENFYLPDVLREFREVAERLRSGISIENSNRGPRSSRNPKNEALEAFIGELLDGAEDRQARSKQPNSFERSRWGIPVGPNSNAFVGFVNAVLKTEFSKHKVRQAFRRVCF